MSRVHRLFELLQILRRHRAPVSGAELAREAGVSLRTIRRDIATLQTLGIDINAGAGVGYAMRSHSLLPPLAFTEEELHALAIGAEWVAHRTDPALVDAVKNALAKIGSVMTPSMRQVLDGNTYYVSDASPTSGTAFDLAQCRKAIREQRKMRITWLESAPDEMGEGMRVEGLVWPIMLGFDSAVRGFAAWSELDGRYRLFDADRVVAAELMDERYARPRRQLVAEWRLVAAQACQARRRS